MKIRHYLKFVFILITAILFTSCKKTVHIDNTLTELPPIFPDYKNVTIPPDLAPLHFELLDNSKYDDACAIFKAGNIEITVSEEGKQFKISKTKWNKLQKQSKTISVIIAVKKANKWIAYAPFHFFISKDAIDGYIAYRLIEPGYERWSEMGIYQRCLRNYDEKAIITNKATGHNCMNCHSFCKQSPDRMLFHMRKDFGGTYIINGNDIEKLNTKTNKTISPLVYPSWHPSGNYVAFSVNTTKQMFHTTNRNRVEVFDCASDVVVYDVNKHEIVTSPLLSSKTSFETFPTFSADGNTLYFCTADSMNIPADYDKVKYSICSISFNQKTRQFGNRIDTIFNAKTKNKSASFPRVSPDGRFLMFTLSNYGNFSIWHREANLCMIDLRTGKDINIDALNSNEAESYHSWSSNSRWVIFSSRRIDGLYTRPFIAHINNNGKVSKPFLLPQDDINYYNLLQKSYNIPEFVKGSVKINSYLIMKEARYGNLISVKAL
ncbi:periplasmic component of the Tol biopolymer transport system [Xylanibacter oryzae DSM 17970]|uniref:Periplasmic component of the Tol biopolymer transport system n=1 Tax=Xylanibacter oryzae DSM 17970 TaxID=915438 RepID=A0ABN0RU96_9BACT|nr:PD40 domain-containing protein [Xylanibacter oryzae]EXG77791.1 periplasmic component of the Tol biopolymer transport system [Xylanibacter oryzae DSM 17970]